MSSNCPVCDKLFTSESLEDHVIKCIERASTKTQTLQDDSTNFGIFNKKPAKKPKLDIATSPRAAASPFRLSQPLATTSKAPKDDEELKRKSAGSKSDPSFLVIPLAEKMRPSEFEDYVGQTKLVGEGSVLRNLLDKNVIPSMILWGAPGCGKTTLAHIISNYCSKHKESMRFVKLSATTCGINDVKEVVKQAKNQLDLSKRRTILFMDEIHRFNKLQQVRLKMSLDKIPGAVMCKSHV